MIRKALTDLHSKIPPDSIIRKGWRKYAPSALRGMLGRCAAALKKDEFLENLKILDAIGKELDARDVSTDKPLRILFGPSFSNFAPCFFHDRIMTYALRLRGAQIIPIYCDSVQHTECDFRGGVWMQGSFEENSVECAERSRKLWSDNPIEAIPFSCYLKSGEADEIISRTKNLGPDEWAVYTEDDLPFGIWAKDILVNNYVVGDYHLILNYHALGLAHLQNLLILKLVYARVLDDVKPDRVICHDSFYGMMAILQVFAEKRKIPFYSHWYGGRIGTWCYARDDAAMNLDFSKPWGKFSSIPLDERQKNIVQGWLDERSAGKGMILNTASLGEHQSLDPGLDNLDRGKKTALLTSNVIWDMAALNKQITFSDMMEWIEKTIQWFGRHPEFQLIIKPHPAETHPSIPATKERVETVLADKGIAIPDNVFLLSSNSKITVYELLPLIEAGLVFTTTVGIEMAAAGLPVVTTAKSSYRGFGFTFDPSTEEEYFQTLQDLLGGESNEDREAREDLARKFILFYFFHYYMKVDLMDYTWGKAPQLKIHALEDLLPGKNTTYDYVLDSIMNGLPIVSNDRWPPES